MKKYIAELLRYAVRTTGSYKPEDCLPLIEESLTASGVECVTRFLNWVVKNNRTFGRNINEVYAEFQREASFATATISPAS